MAKLWKVLLAVKKRLLNNTNVSRIKTAVNTWTGFILVVTQVLFKWVDFISLLMTLLMCI